MKKLIYLSLVLTMILVSCESSPIAMFSANPGNPVVGEEVWFTNESDNAYDFEWNFGDGYISNEPSPVHKFTSTGTFTVVLKVWSESGLTDESSLTLEVKIPTLLEIEVLEYFEEYPVAGASIILYPTLTDWENETNRIAEGYSNSNGRIRFDGLLPKRYYVDVYGPNHDNYKLAEEDAGFIETDVLLSGELNEFTALVDYYPPKMRSGDNTKILKNIQKSAEKTTESRKAKERLK